MLVGLQEKGLFIKIEKGIDMYKVHVSTIQKRTVYFFYVLKNAHSLKINTYTNVNVNFFFFIGKKAEIQKNNLILDIIFQFEDDVEKDSFKKDSPKRPKNLKVAAKCIHISWKHKSEVYRPFTLMKNDLSGNSKIFLDKNIEYTMQDIIVIVVNQMKNDQNKEMLENSDVGIGFSDNTFIKEFINNEGESCKFWDWIQLIQERNGQVKLYLISQAKVDKNLKEVFECNENSKILHNLQERSTIVEKKVFNSSIVKVNNNSEV